MNRQQRPITDREIKAWLAAGAPEFDTTRPFSAPNRPCTLIKSTAYDQVY